MREVFPHLFSHFCPICLFDRLCWFLFVAFVPSLPFFFFCKGRTGQTAHIGDMKERKANNRERQLVEYEMKKSSSCVEQMSVSPLG